MHESNDKFVENSKNYSRIDGNLSTHQSCVLILEASKLQGIFTERDLVEVIAVAGSTAGLTIGDVMNREIITLTSTGKEDVFTVLNLMESNRIASLICCLYYLFSSTLVLFFLVRY